MRLEILQDYVSQYPNPIEFAIGDVLALGRVDPDYPGWIRTRTDAGNEGWAPLKYIDMSDDGTTGTANCTYTARELSVRSGEIVEVLTELDGWLWCRNPEKRCGWIPAAVGNLVE